MANKRITKASVAKEGEYNLITGPFPYHAREDKTTLNPNILISPSQNVVNNFANRLQLVKGYTLDGGTSSVVDSGILSNYDFYTVKNDTLRNVRAGFLTTAGNDGKLQYRWVDPTTKVVTWRDLKTSLTNVRLSFDGFYFDTTEALKLLLWVDGTGNVFEWSGAVTTLASATSTTITKQGTTTWAQEGFYTAKTGRTIVIDGVTATYTGGETTTTLTGVSVDFSAKTAGTVIHQGVVTNAISGMTDIPATYLPTVIASGRKNQVYLGSSVSNTIYISKQDDFKIYTFTASARKVGEGAKIVLDAPPVKFIAQEVHGDGAAYDLWMSTGQDRWGIIRSTVSSDNIYELLEYIRIKSAPLQGALSDRLCAKMKNHIVFIGHDKVLNAMGYVSYQFVPVMQDLSYPIIDDINSYDFTDGSVFYHKNYLYVAVPKHGIIRVYNMTNQTEQQEATYNPIEQLNAKEPFFWEAPITYPISGFYVVDGELYGHGYNSSESYKLFTGGSLNGQTIDANATLAYDAGGDRTQSKGSNEVWMEGYIKQNTDLNCVVRGDLDYFVNEQTVTLKGSDNRFVAFGGGGHSLGQDSLGSKPLGGTLTSNSTLPAWFHCAKTYQQIPYYLQQISFNTKGIDLQWELLTFGTNGRMTNEGNNNLTD